MRLLFTSISILLLYNCGTSQSLTGIWRGYFVQNDFDMYKGRPTEDKYKYEIQLNNLVNNAIEGVTYSYKTTVFYGKASMQGIFRKGTKNLLIREVKMLDLKISDNTSPCLMTCYLDYEKNGSKETLIGTYTSISERNTNCGSGTVYLEKVPTTDFEKEPFLSKKSNESVTKKIIPNTTNKLAETKNSKPPILLKKGTIIPKNIPQQKIVSSNQKPQFKPGAEGYMIEKDAKKIIDIKPKIADTIKPLVKDVPKQLEPSLPIPKVLLERENNLQKTLIVDQQDVRIDYYDNGQIDNDSITVYHNNQLLINRGRLDTRPLTLNIHLDENSPFYELITVAVNLGDVPPNTALMVITAGKKRYEVTITSDDKKNAKVVLEYRKPTDKNK